MSTDYEFTLTGTNLTNLHTCGCCSPPIDTDCCPDDAIPDTLTATITNVSGCACADGVEVTLTHSSGVWSGSATLGTCGDTVNISIDCPGGSTSASDWDMDWSTDTDGGGGTNNSPTASSCGPLDLTYDLPLATACGGALDSATVNITE